MIVQITNFSVIFRAQKVKRENGKMSKIPNKVLLAIFFFFWLANRKKNSEKRTVCRWVKTKSKRVGAWGQETKEKQKKHHSSDGNYSKAMIKNSLKKNRENDCKKKASGEWLGLNKLWVR